MAILIKSLANGQAASSDSAIYTAANAALIRSMRFVSRETGTSLALTLKLKQRTNPGSTPATYATRQIGPSSMSVPAKGMYVDSTEITLAPDDSIVADVPGTSEGFDFVISGIERES